MTTLTLSDQNEPSDISATATTVCVSDNRIRVEMLARPARGPSLALMTFGCGFFSLKTWMALTWVAGVIGLSTATAQGTVLPFSTSGGISSLTLPTFSLASPMTLAIAACISAG